MRQKIEFSGEQLLIKEHCEVVRFKVYKGWIVHTTMSDKNKLSTSSVYIPDSEHSWIHVPTIPNTEL